MTRTEAERADLMQSAGASHTVSLREILAPGGRATTRGAMSHVVDSWESLFAEIPPTATVLRDRRHRGAPAFAKGLP